MASISLPLRGPAGEPIDWARTLASHGVAELLPMRLDHAAQRFTVTLPTARSARTVTVTRRGRGLRAEIAGTVGANDLARIEASLRTILALDRDLSSFYAAVADDPMLSWAAAGAGRMIRSATVFEEVVKTICTTNCTWAATERMNAAIVEHLGTRAPGAPATGTGGRTFPSPAAMAEAGESFYRDVARAGYRASSFLTLARGVADGSIELESLGTASRDELSDDDVRQRLLALPGVGPYAAAHVMLMLGRASDLILDSWTRPTWTRVSGARRPPADSTIRRRFARYRDQAGLAFWLVCTQDWVEG